MGALTARLVHVPPPPPPTTTTTTFPLRRSNKARQVPLPEALPRAPHNPADRASPPTCPCLPMPAGAVPTAPLRATFPTRRRKDGTRRKDPGSVPTAPNGTMATSTLLAPRNSNPAPTARLHPKARLVLLLLLLPLAAHHSTNSPQKVRRPLRHQLRRRVPPRLLRSWSPSPSANPRQLRTRLLRLAPVSTKPRRRQPHRQSQQRRPRT